MNDSGGYLIGDLFNQQQKKIIYIKYVNNKCICFIRVFVNDPENNTSSVLVNRIIHSWIILIKYCQPTQSWK